MRLVEKCCCGASIEIGWSEPEGYGRDAHKMRESERAKVEIATFRRNHKNHAIMAAASNTGSRPEGE